MRRPLPSVSEPTPIYRQMVNREGQPVTKRAQTPLASTLNNYSTSTDIRHWTTDVPINRKIPNQTRGDPLPTPMIWTGPDTITGGIPLQEPILEEPRALVEECERVEEVAPEAVKEEPNRIKAEPIKANVDEEKHLLLDIIRGWDQPKGRLPLCWEKYLIFDPEPGKTPGELDQIQRALEKDCNNGNPKKLRAFKVFGTKERLNFDVIKSWVCLNVHTYEYELPPGYQKMAPREGKMPLVSSISTYD